MYLIEYVNCVKTCEERSQSIELESYVHAAHKLNFGHKAWNWQINNIDIFCVRT